MKLKFTYYNANPFNNSCGDCAIRAISKCENISWEEAYKNLSKIALELKDILTTKQCILTYLKNRYKIEWCNIDLKNYEPTIGRKLLLLSSKKYNNAHLIYTENGAYYDTARLDKQHYQVVEVYTPLEVAYDT